MASSKARSSRPGRHSARSSAQIPLATPTMAAKPAVSSEPDEAAEPEVPQDTVAAEGAGTASRPPRWLQYVSFVLALAGLGVSVYETYAHFTGNHLAGCPASSAATFNCTAVITSPESMVFGVIPVAILGLLFYVFAVAIFSPWAWRLRNPLVGWARLGSTVIGIGFVMYLVYAEVVEIQQLCEYCTAVHVITFLLFCITAISAALWGLTPAASDE